MTSSSLDSHRWFALALFCAAQLIVVLYSYAVLRLLGDDIWTINEVIIAKL